MRKFMVCIFILLPLAALAQNIEHTQHLALSIQGIRTLLITCASGSLDVYGIYGYDRIKVTATVKISDMPQATLTDFLDRHVRLSLHKRQHQAILQSVFQNQHQMEADAKIDLSVAIPKNLPVEIIDGSGWIEVSGLDANLEIADGSGSIDVRDIKGNVKIEDGSGMIRIAEIRGNLELKDGSGSIQVDRITGDVRLVDGSGEMSISDIEGNLAIRDGSGGIEIKNVTRNVLIKEAGSGILEIDGVKGTVVNWE